MDVDKDKSFIETMGPKPELVETMDVDKDQSFITKDYQMEAFEVGMKRNTIAVLETGAGKALIAVMLIKEIVKSIELNGEKKLIIFMAPAVHLVHQQYEVIKLHTELKVEEYYGAKGIDQWNYVTWEKEVAEHDAVKVCIENAPNDKEESELYNKSSSHFRYYLEEVLAAIEESLPKGKLMRNGKLVSLSEQQLVDCDHGGQNSGCNGGYMVEAFKHIIKNNGLASEKDYPYHARDETCKEKVSPAATISGYELVPSNDESALLKAVANQPVSVAVDAGGNDFQFYSDGVFEGKCGNKLDHAVTVVGYGTSKTGTKYWKIKNSWGRSWGNQGYMKLAREVEGTVGGLCGVAMEASYPTA